MLLLPTLFLQFPRRLSEQRCRRYERWTPPPWRARWISPALPELAPFGSVCHAPGGQTSPPPWECSSGSGPAYPQQTPWPRCYPRSKTRAATQHPSQISVGKKQRVYCLDLRGPGIPDVPEQPCLLYALITQQQHSQITRRYYPTGNWLSSRCLA